jgi:hypothetical protein
MAQPILVKIIPIEYQKHNKYPRIVIFNNVKVNPDLTQQQFDEILQKANLKKKARGICNPHHYIFYNYSDEPMVVIDVETGEVFTTKTIIEYYGIRKAQIQASIILKILKRFGQAKFTRRILSTYRLGKDPETIKQIVEAYMDLVSG